MSIASDAVTPAPVSTQALRDAKRERWHTRINRVASSFELVGHRFGVLAGGGGGGIGGARLAPRAR